jgi:hypothetical protein
MSKVLFNGSDGWFCPPRNKYGLSTKEIKDVTLDNFSFLARVKVDWSALDNNQPHREGGIIIKNGQHTGISAIKPDDEQCFIKGTVWTELNGERIATDILLRVNWGPNDLTKELDIGFTYDKQNKKLSLYCSGQWDTNTFEGEIIDYSNSWLWVGVCNPLESCPPEFRHYFYGNMSYVGIYQSCLTKDEIKNTFSDLKNVNYDLSPVCVFNFEKQTPYKVLDITKNGNNIIKFDKTWMDSI